eukprot:augustus_masked-scaffold_12-processed-gene-9.44-mRNA-1 protein AED:1.00 eAED:1.00 QI:0/0/0/0/1/1/2/0/511
MIDLTFDWTQVTDDFMKPELHPVTISIGTTDLEKASEMLFEILNYSVISSLTVYDCSVADWSSFISGLAESMKREPLRIYLLLAVEECSDLMSLKVYIGNDNKYAYKNKGFVFLSAIDLTAMSCGVGMMEKHETDTLKWANNFIVKVALCVDDEAGSELGSFPSDEKKRLISILGNNNRKILAKAYSPLTLNIKIHEVLSKAFNNNKFFLKVSAGLEETSENKEKLEELKQRLGKTDLVVKVKPSITKKVFIMTKVNTGRKGVTVSIHNKILALEKDCIDLFQDLSEENGKDIQVDELFELQQKLVKVSSLLSHQIERYKSLSQTKVQEVKVTKPNGNEDGMSNYIFKLLSANGVDVTSEDYIRFYCLNTKLPVLYILITEFFQFYKFTKYDYIFFQKMYTSCENTINNNFLRITSGEKCLTLAHLENLRNKLSHINSVKNGNFEFKAVGIWTRQNLLAALKYLSHEEVSVNEEPKVFASDFVVFYPLLSYTNIGIEKLVDLLCKHFESTK